MTQTDSSFKIDFAVVKEKMSFADLLAHYDLTERFSSKGDHHLVGKCPLGKKDHGKADSFNIDLEKGNFKCFACSKRGSVLDFVHFLDDISLVEAAEKILQLSGAGESEHTQQSETEVKEVQFRQAFMRFDEAVDGVRDGNLLAQDLLVIDVSTVQFLRGLIYND